MTSKIADLEKRLKELEEYVFNFDDFLPARSLVEKTKNYLEKRKTVTVDDIQKRFHIPEERAKKLIELFINYGFLTEEKNNSFKINEEAYFKYEDTLIYSGSEDDLLDKARELAKDYDNISASLLQRKFSIGFVHACRLIDQLEKKGIISPAMGSLPRKVLKK